MKREEEEEEEEEEGEEEGTKRRTMLLLLWGGESSVYSSEVSEGISLKCVCEVYHSFWADTTRRHILVAPHFLTHLQWAVWGLKG